MSLLIISSTKNFLVWYLTSMVLFRAAAAEITIEEISFPSKDGQLQLEGFLYIPSAPALSEQTFPGVVLVHGSGPQSRDSLQIGQLGAQFPSPISVFADIGTALASDGIAVLTYDKRSCGTFNNCYENNYPLPDADLVIYDFIDDAMAAIDYLAQVRTDVVDPQKVVIAGHSQAGSFVPILLDAMSATTTTSGSTLASGIMLAGPFQPIDELLGYQLEFTFQLLELTGGLNQSQALELPAVAQLNALTEGVQQLRQGTYMQDTILGTPTVFWNSWFNASDHALEAASTMQQPMLVLQGLLDSNVNFEQFEAWGEYLEIVGADFQLEAIPCVTHALNCFDQTSGTVGTMVSELVTNAMIEFIQNTTATMDDTTTTPSPSSSPTSINEPTPTEAPAAAAPDDPTDSPTEMPASTTPAAAPDDPTDSPTEMPSTTPTSSSDAYAQIIGNLGSAWFCISMLLLPKLL